ncbi:MAG: RNA-guided endonuclease InsQ/TnpB family protein [Candidatus Sericytochromatia bacterium]
MQIRRTIRIRLRPNAEAAELLVRTVTAYTWSFNEVCRYGWENGVSNGVKLHKATYYAHREATGLPAQLTCAARVKATEALKSVRARMKNDKKASCPNSSACAIRYDDRSYQVSFERREVSLLTLSGRVRLHFKIPTYHAEYATWETTCADLVHDRQGRWWLHVVVTQDVEETPSTGPVVGVDLGIVKPATDSRGVHYGSEHWKLVEDRRFQLRRRLQAKGTKSARRHLKRLSGKTRRFRRDCDHVLSKQLVHSVEPGATLAFEDLTDIRSRAKARKEQRRRLHSWSFHQLQAFVEYKAAARGVAVVYVDPRFTSQKCACCGHRERGNRRSQACFSCRSCGHQANADVNAAINIRANHLVIQGCPVNQPIVSGQASA